jgi:uncharacterized phage protein (TIGR02220 family)
MKNANESLAVLKGLLSSGTVSYQAIFSKAFHSIPIGVYLSQMYFWQENSRYKSKETHQQFEGRTFICRTADEWFEETGMTTEQQSKARETLRPFGVLLEKKAGMPAKLWQHIDLEALVTVLYRYMETGSAVTVDHRSKERYFTRASNGRILPQETVKNRTTYSRELESLESKEESGREIAPPIAPADETVTFGAEKSNEPLQGGGAAGGPGGQPTPRGGNPEDWTWVDDPAPAHVTTYAVPTSETFEAAPGGPTYRADVPAPAEREVVKPAKQKPGVPQIVRDVVAYLNEKTGKAFKAETKGYDTGILARQRDGATLEEMQRVIDNRVAAWGASDKMRECLNPTTLFRPTNFANYLAESNAPKAVQQGQGGPGVLPPNMQRTQSPIHQSPVFGERRV